MVLTYVSVPFGFKPLKGTSHQPQPIIRRSYLGVQVNKKYLYGKSCHLSGMMKGEKGIRFSHLSQYALLENEQIKDNETGREITLNKNLYTITVNNRTLNPEEMTRHPTIIAPTRHCYCLCLSNKGDAPDLYEKFKADLCIEFDVEKLLSIFDRIGIEILKGTEFIANNVKYYSSDNIEVTYIDDDILVFYKNERFSSEDEFRIAMFYPLDKTSFQAGDTTIQINKKGETDFLFIRGGIPDCITNTFYKT